MAAVLRRGAVVAVFPEGTTWCGRDNGRFRSAMFQAAIDAGVPVAPVTLRFRSANGAGTTVAAYVGEETLVGSLRRVVLAAGLRVTVQSHDALYPAPGASRQALARAAQAVIQPPTPAAAPAPIQLRPDVPERRTLPAAA